MSMIAELPTAEPEPFPYGYRDRCVQESDGTWRYVRTPLTLWDLLHPDFGDVPLDGSLHSLMCVYLVSVFQARLADDPESLVLTNTGIYWDTDRFTHHAPDVAAILGIRSRQGGWTTFKVREEGVRPRLIVEIVSVKYRKNDVEDKLDHYHHVRIPTYVIVDRDRDDGPTRLLGYTWAPQRYEPMTPDANGRLWLSDLRVWLAARGDRVVCFDENDKELGDYTEVTRQLQVEVLRADEMSLRADLEFRRANEAMLRAEEATRLAEVEKQARLAAEERVRRLEERLRGNDPDHPLNGKN